MKKKRTNYGFGRKYPSEYETWKSIKKRCYNPNNRNYKYYGGKGVIMCDRWIESFENFLQDMGQKPSNEHSIDRFPNNDGNYEPDNCRWATKKEQINNRKNSIVINGKSLSDFARELGLNRSSVCSRLLLGWSLEKATTTPNQKPKTLKL